MKINRLAVVLMVATLYASFASPVLGKARARDDSDRKPSVLNAGSLNSTGNAATASALTFDVSVDDFGWVQVGSGSYEVTTGEVTCSQATTISIKWWIKQRHNGDEIYPRRVDGSAQVQCDGVTRWEGSAYGSPLDTSKPQGLIKLRAHVADPLITHVLLVKHIFVRACSQIGTLAADDISGTSHGDQICALDGNDFVRAFKGNDTLRMWFGDDLAHGGPGADVIKGAGGSDELRGGRGNDHLWGDESGDTLIGGHTRDILRGGPGPDVLRGGHGRDACYGGPGHDIFVSCETKRQ